MGPGFPVITIRDMVRAQAMLLDHLGIDQLLCVVGGSMGGMQVLQWARAIRSACSRRCRSRPPTRHSAQNIAFHEVGRQAVMADPDWRGGAIFRGHHARIAASPSRAWPRTSPICRTRRCTASSAAAAGPRTADLLLRRRFPGGELSALPGLELRRALRRQFSYLYITRAMDYFDLAADHGGVLANAFRG
jgi:homoserine O-acetyltransferase